MKRIRGINTNPGITLRKALWSQGIRYRLNVKKLPGKPDIVILKSKLVIFIDGEFWHGYKWEEKRPKLKSNRDYWIKKIEGNIERDTLNAKKLEDLGYTVFRFWEHEIKKNLSGCMSIIISHIQHTS